MASTKKIASLESTLWTETWNPFQASGITEQKQGDMGPLSTFLKVDFSNEWEAPSSTQPPSAAKKRSMAWRQKQKQKADVETSSSDSGDENANLNLYKTELCRSFQETSFCRYGAKCQFAHGEHELRTVQRHPKYKTAMCRSFMKTGTCNYGERCHFVHEKPVNGSPSLTPLSQSPTSSRPTTPAVVEAPRAPSNDSSSFEPGDKKDKDGQNGRSRLSIFQNLTSGQTLMTAY